MAQFESFGKIARFSRECVITEKIDGTNSQIFIEYSSDEVGNPKLVARCLAYGVAYDLFAGSRNKFITPEDDNAGFARWVHANAEQLAIGLGEGRHYGEWWGSGIQRGYGLEKGTKKFSLFNVGRWKDERLPFECPTSKPVGGIPRTANNWHGDDRTQVPDCCSVVPILAAGDFNSGLVTASLEDIREFGSAAALGFQRPEGIIIYHVAGGIYFKKTLEGDGISKGEAKARGINV